MSNGEVIKNAGWYEVDAMPDKKTSLPSFTENEIVSGTYKLKEGKTQPPKRYTDRTIISAMKNAGDSLEDEEEIKLMKDSGIGTPATRAGIIETIINREYVKREKGKLIPTPIGIEVINFIPIEILKSAKMTGQMEKRLSDIENGIENPNNVLNDFKENVVEWCKAIKALPVPTNESKRNNMDTIGNCPVCGNGIIDFGSYCKCKNTDCGFSISKEICSKKLSNKNITDLLSGKTVSIKGFTSKNGKKFDAPIKIDESGKLIFDFQQTAPTVIGKCPVCGNDVMDRKSYCKCSGDNCNFSINREICGKKLTDKNITDLLSGKTISMSGLVSKKAILFLPICS